MAKRKKLSESELLQEETYRKQRFALGFSALGVDYEEKYDTGEVKDGVLSKNEVSAKQSKKAKQ